MDDLIGKAKGGFKKNASMTLDERKNHALKMVEAKKKKAEMRRQLSAHARASHRGSIEIGELSG